jgi:hypothetical protein
MIVAALLSYAAVIFLAASLFCYHAGMHAGFM